MKLGIPQYLAGALAVAMASCSPYPENLRPGLPGDTQSLTSAQQQKIRAEQEKMRNEQANRDNRGNQAGSNERKDPPAPNSSKPGNSGDKERSNPSPVKPPTNSGTTAKRDWPVAEPIPGKPGFVLSPYNQRQIEVSGMASGLLVRDPSYDPSEKKLFRVP